MILSEHAEVIDHATCAEPVKEPSRARIKRRKREDAYVDLYGDEYSQPKQISALALTVEEQLRAYMLSPKLLTVDDNPLEFWKGKAGCWPELCEYALRVLVMQPTETDAERRFSQAGNIAIDQRASLHPETLGELLIVYANISLYNYPAPVFTVSLETLATQKYVPIMLDDDSV